MQWTRPGIHSNLVCAACASRCLHVSRCWRGTPPLHLHLLHAVRHALGVQDICITLEVPDPMALPVALHKVLRVLSSLPRLERFVADVCEVSLQTSAPCVSLSTLFLVM